MNVRSMLRARRALRQQIRAWLTMGLLVATSFVVLVRILPEKAISARQPPDRASMLEAEVECVLVQLRNSWQRAERQHILEAAAPHAERYTWALRKFLARPGHSLVVPALELAGFLQAQDLLPDVRRIAERPELRARALAAADLIEPLPDAELYSLLRDDDRSMLLAALEMASRRENPPLEPMIELLAHDSSQVAEAALASLPERLPEDCRGAIQRITADVRPEVATRGWQAMLRIPNPDADPTDSPPDEDQTQQPATDAEAYAALLQRLDALDDATRLAALEELSVLGRAEGSEVVTSILEGNNPDVIKKQACVYLGRVDHRPAVRPLIDVLRNATDPGLQANAQWSLQRITGQKIKQDAALWDQWWSVAGQSFATPPR